MKDRFHLIGIGGIGMSALARFLMAGQSQVSGSDPSSSGEGEKLESEGVKVYKAHQASNVDSKETTVVYSTAIPKDNPELLEAQKLGCKIWHRSDLLAYLMEKYQSIAISGTHGKTSTSALLSHVLMTSKLSPSFVVGGLVLPMNCNSQVGKGKYFVAEADESDGSFLKYHPSYAILTNLEADHLNHYKDLEEIKDAFLQFSKQVQKKEWLFWCKDCRNLSSLNLPGISYGFNKNADLVVSHFKQKGFSSSFDISFQGKKYCNIELSMIGPHNALNAAAIFGLSLLLGLDENLIREAFKTFLGIKRRAEKKGEAFHISIYDDYAHHPTEVSCLLKSFRQAFPKRRIIAFFQPHRYSRFIPFKDDFAASFKKASEVWVSDVYSAGEPKEPNLNMNEYALEIESRSSVKARYVPLEEALKVFEKEIRPFDIFLTIGAGDITQFGIKAFDKVKEIKPKLKVGLIKGSKSYEHYVSLVSARFFEKSCDLDLIDLSVYTISPDGTWSLQEGGKEKELTIEQVVSRLLKKDIMMPILHGREGEDGMIQGFLRTLNLPFIGPSYALSSFNMNKVWMKLFVQSLGIETPKGVYFTEKEWRGGMDKKIAHIEKTLKYPLAIKPANMGSTIGVSFAKNALELKDAIDNVFKLDHVAIVEKRIFARELEVSCLDSEEGLIVTGPGEVKSDARFYNYEAKYSQNPIEKIVEPNLCLKISSRCRELAKQIYQKMQMKGYCRIDFFLTKGDRLIFAEVNTQPGTTPRSLFQRTLLAKGFKDNELINQMIIDGLYRHRLEEQKSMKIKHFLTSIKDVTHK